jgi:hypothetical protein
MEEKDIIIELTRNRVGDCLRVPREELQEVVANLVEDLIKGDVDYLNIFPRI